MKPWLVSDAVGLSVPESGSTVVSQEDIENHNKEGGCWIIIHGRVYDVKQLAKEVGGGGGAGRRDREKVDLRF